MNTENLQSLRTGLKRMVIRECNVKNVAPEQISDDEQIIGGGTLSLDSLDAVEIVSALERSFGVKLENAGAARHVVKSFADMSNFVVQNAPADRIADFIR